MLPFEIQTQPGKPVSEQLVYAVKKAVACGHLTPGDAFPSVRELSRELKINPNTAQKAVAQLTQMGILQIQPGIGTQISEPVPLKPDEIARMLQDPLESLAVEAKRLGMTRTQLETSLRDTWKTLTPEKPHE